MTKLRRNAACHCGSGLKLKKCHGAFAFNSSTGLPPHIQREIDERMKEEKALDAQREKQQGLGRPIVSSAIGEGRMVAVGMTVHWSKNWATFHDFLREYFLKSLGDDWLKAQAALSADRRHPVLRWHDMAIKNLLAGTKQTGRIHSAPMTGAARAFLNLAYNMYLIEHHNPDESVIKAYLARLKSAREDTLTGALFETYAAAAFLKAGFELEYEKAKGVAISHVEFTARYPKTGAKFSVEVKARERTASEATEADPEIDDVKRLRVGNKLSKALAKEAQHMRIVIIEVNVPDVIEPCPDNTSGLTGWPAAALEQIRYQETQPFKRGDEKPSAYVIVTNHAFHNNLDALDVSYAAFSTGFKMPDFCPDAPFKGYYALLQAQNRHSEVFALLNSLTTHYEIPSTFGGEIPEFKFGENTEPRLLYNRRYMVPTEDGTLAQGRLYQATVDQINKQVIGAYELSTGAHVLATTPISDAELAAYRRFPDTFFGQIQQVNKPAKTLEDLCSFFYENNRQLHRDKLLNALVGHPEFERLKSAEHQELAAIHSERQALHAFNLPKPSQGK